MPQTWKLVLIGGEVTVLAAFTGLGLHLVMQPHRFPVAPPPLLIPSPQVRSQAVLPTPSTSGAARQSAPAVVPSAPALGPELLSKFGQQDRRLLLGQWEILQRLIGAMERFIEHTIVPAMEGRR